MRRDTLWDKPQSESSFAGLDTMLSLLRGWEYRPVKPRRGSKLPVLVKAKLEQGLSLPVPLRSPCGGAVDCGLFPHQTVPEVVTPCPQQELQVELAEMEEQWLDDYVQCGPFRFQQVDRLLRPPTSFSLSQCRFYQGKMKTLFLFSLFFLFSFPSQENKKRFQISFYLNKRLNFCIYQFRQCNKI